MEDGNAHFLPGLKREMDASCTTISGGALSMACSCITSSNCVNRRRWGAARTERGWNARGTCIHRQVAVTTCLAVTAEARGEPITPYAGKRQAFAALLARRHRCPRTGARRAVQLRLYAARDALMSMHEASHPILPGLDAHRLAPADWRNRPVP